MRTKLGMWALVLGVAISVVGCASPPTAAIDAAKASLAQAVAGGAGEYAPGSLTAAQDAQAALDAEVNVQAGAWMKTYTKASELAVAAKAAGDRALSDATAGKAKVKAEATTAVDDAKKAVADAEAQLAKAPKGKGSAADLAAMKTDLTNAAASVADAATALGAERFADAKARAAAATKAATSVTTAIETAMSAKKPAAAKMPMGAKKR
jgi:trimeric autotransporter adhesin